jgi:hypothetical protein
VTWCCSRRRTWQARDDDRARPPAALQASARDDLYLAAIKAWQAIAPRQPAPDMDPAELFQEHVIQAAPERERSGAFQGN